MIEVTDPVCGHSFAWEDARGTCRYRGRLYYFCGKGCWERFNKNPVYYLSRNDPKARTRQFHSKFSQN